jgi:diguanylate cyclase (GGDEF)-like protein/hemerythrin-like metal-binding protein/PAS domain S-box-containing protein
MGGARPMKYRFIDLVDIEAFQSMLKSFYEATGILHGLVDSENNVISALGWQEACTEFHRLHPRTNANCLESNRFLAEHLDTGCVVGYQCQNGLMDYATPIVVEGRQLATLYFGQVFHEPPDLEFFRRLARDSGFDEEAYLAAIGKVPVVPRERVESIMAFYQQLGQMFAGNGLDHIRQREAERRLAELNRDLAQRVQERTTELAAKNSKLSAEIAERRLTEEALRSSQTQLQAILDSSPVGIGWSNADGEIEYINQKFIDLFGYTLDEIPDIESWSRLAYPDGTFRKEVVGHWARQTAAAKHSGAKAPDLEAPIVCRDGSIRHTLIAMSWVGDRRLVNISDISERWRAEQRDRARNATLELIAKGASLPEILNAVVRSMEAEDPGMIGSILLIDRAGRHLRSGAAPGLPDFYNTAIDGVEIGDGVGSCGTAAHTMDRVIVSDIQQHPYWANYRDLAAQAGLASCWSEPILSSAGRLLGTFAMYHRQPCTPDEHAFQRMGYAANLASVAIEHHQTLGELEHQAHTDYLTELVNRRHFMELAEAELIRAHRYRKPISMLMFDVDHFKWVNDTHGHRAGDKVLQALAGIVRQTLREVDIVGRMGGEEFAAILPETNTEQAWNGAERLRLAVADSKIPMEAGGSVNISISIGVATMAQGAADVETLLKLADEALYVAKNSGRNQVRMAAGDSRKPEAGDVLTNFVKLSWRDPYACGHPLIDAQHRALFDQANDLLAAMLSGCSADRIATSIDALGDDIVQHFRDEEAVLAECGFPGAAAHSAIHRELVDRVVAVVDRHRAGHVDIGELFQFLAVDVIARHMLRDDREFFPYVKG